MLYPKDEEEKGGGDKREGVADKEEEKGGGDERERVADKDPE